MRATNLKDNQLFTGFQTTTKNRYFYVVLLAIVTFIIFCQVIGHEFVLYDDDQLVYQNPYTQSFNVPNILHFWENPDYGNLYAPLTQTIWAIEATFAKTTSSDSNKIEFNPAIFHATNLIFHIFNALLVFLILRILVKNELASFFGALLFALHPVQVESVAWVTGLRGVLSGFFSLVAIWQYLLYAKLSMTSPEGIKIDQDHKKWKILHYLIAVFSFLLAILSKPSSVIVPMVTFILDYFILKRPLRQIVVSLIGFIAIDLPMIGVTFYFQHFNRVLTFNLSFFDRLLVVTDTLAFYLYKILLPLSLGPDYGRTPKFVLSQNLIYFAWIIPVVFLILAYILKKQRQWLLASAGVFIAGILPVLGFIQFLFQETSTVADRYLYLSMLGPGMALAFILSRDILSLNKKRLIMGICGVMLGVLGILSMKQTQYWENTITFCKHAIEVNANDHIFHTNLGNFLAEKQKIDEAVFHYSEALRLSPDNVRTHTNLGLVLARQGKFDEAVFHYSEALRLAPDMEQARTNLGIALVRQEKFDKAVFHLSEALKSNPNNVLAHLYLGYTLARQGKIDEAVHHYSEAVRLSPNNVGAHNDLGVALVHQGKIDEAIFHFNEALKINPSFRDAQKNLIEAQSLKK